MRSLSSYHINHENRLYLSYSSDHEPRVYLLVPVSGTGNRPPIVSQWVKRMNRKAIVSLVSSPKCARKMTRSETASEALNFLFPWSVLLMEHLVMRCRAPVQVSPALH